MKLKCNCRYDIRKTKSTESLQSNLTGPNYTKFKWTELKNEFSQDSHINCDSNTGKMGLQFQKMNDCTPTFTSKNLTTVAVDKSGIYSKFANILDGKTSKLSKIEETTSLHDKLSPIGKHRSIDTTLGSKDQMKNGSYNRNTDISKDILQYYQPNYLPSSGKSIPNNVKKSGLSSTGIYKNKLEEQTLIGQQVCYISLPLDKKIWEIPHS